MSFSKPKQADSKVHSQVVGNVDTKKDWEDPLFIKVEALDAKSCIDDRVKTEYDQVFRRSLYQTRNKNKDPIMYNMIYRGIRRRVQSGSLDKRQIIVTSSDNTVISPIVTAYNHVESDSPLQVLYLTATPDIIPLREKSYEGYNLSFMADTLGLIQPSFTGHDMDLQSEQITMFGLDDKLMIEEEKSVLDGLSIRNYDMKTIRKLKVKKIITKLVKKYNKNSSPVMIAINMNVLRSSWAPAVYRRDHKAEYEAKNGMTNNEYYKTIQFLTGIKNLVGICIVGYDYGLIDDPSLKQSCYLLTTSFIRETITKLARVKEKKINFITEDTKFLIYRPVASEDYGWDILKDATWDFIDEYIKKRLSCEEKIAYERINIDGTKTYVMITSTTMREQQTKIYDPDVECAPIDCILFPDQKYNMMRYLVKIPQSEESGQPIDSTKPNLEPESKKEKNVSK